MSRAAAFYGGGHLHTDGRGGEPGVGPLAPMGRTEIHRTGIAAAHGEMCMAALQDRKRAMRRARISALIQHVDLLLEELERLNLASRKSVPASWRKRLAELAPLLPFSLDPRWLRPRSTVKAIDVLFEIQLRLMRLRSGPLEPDLIDSDAALELDPAYPAPAGARSLHRERRQELLQLVVEGRYSAARSGRCNERIDPSARGSVIGIEVAPSLG